MATQQEVFIGKTPAPRGTIIYTRAARGGTLSRVECWLGADNPFIFRFYLGGSLIATFDFSTPSLWIAAAGFYQTQPLLQSVSSGDILTVAVENTTLADDSDVTANWTIN